MTFKFPSPVPEVPVRDIAAAAAYYRNNFGFSLDWERSGVSEARFTGEIIRHVVEGNLLDRVDQPIGVKWWWFANRRWQLT